MKAIVTSPTKLALLVLGVLFLMLGLVGLIIPIIPGILFLFAAVYVLGKVSQRVRRWSHGNAMYRDMSTQFDRIGRVSVADRVKVAGLMAVSGVVRGIDYAITGATTVYRRVRP